MMWSECQAFGLGELVGTWGETRKQGDKGARRQGDKETRRELGVSSGSNRPAMRAGRSRATPVEALYSSSVFLPVILR